MNRAALVSQLVEKTGLNKKTIEQVLTLYEELIVAALQRGDTVSLTSFGKFSAKRRHARMGVDPRHPANRIQIPEVIVPKFTSGKGLKDALNQRS